MNYLASSTVEINKVVQAKDLTQASELHKKALEKWLKEYLGEEWDITVRSTIAYKLPEVLN